MQENKNKRNISPVERRIETTDKTVCNFPSLLRAEQRCHRHVGYKNSVSRFHLLKLSRCYNLYNELCTNTYEVGIGKSFEIYEPKYRIVTAIPYKDRIPQTSFVLNVFYPNVVPYMINENFACYKNKGVDAARKLMIMYLKSAKITDYVLCTDIKSYFASIDHQILSNELLPFIGTENIDFYRKVIDSNKKSVGLALSSEINQLSASSFLYKFDQFASNIGKYERYMDDIRFVGSKTECEFILNALDEFLKSRALTLSIKKTYIQPITKPVSFLGFTFLKHDSGKITLKRKKDKLNREKRKLKRLKKNHIPFDRIKIHYKSVREAMSKGIRSGVVKLDKYFNTLFMEEIQNENSKSKQQIGSMHEESVFPLVTCGRKNRGRNQNGVSHPREVFDLSGTNASQKETYECPPG